MVLPYTQVVAGSSTNVTTPTTEQFNQGNDQLTPYNSAVNNGYYRQISQGVANLSAEVINVIEEAGLTPDSSLTQLLTALDDLYPRASTLGTASTKNIGTSSGQVPLIGTQSATTSLAGLASLATQAEVNAGTDANKIVTSNTLLNASGRCIQFASSLSNTQTSTTTVIPRDGSIPQSSEGAQFTTLSFTPKLATSTLKITVISQLGGNTTATGCVALFVDSGTDAIATGAMTIVNASSEQNSFTYIISSGSTTARTYKMRYGPDGGTCYINRTSDVATLYGGTLRSGIIIEEFA